MDDKLKMMKLEYENIEIPKELDAVVERALGKRKRKRAPIAWFGGVAAAAVLFTAGVNTSPAMADALGDIPVIGKMVHVLTFTEYKVEQDNRYHADIKVPEISGLDGALEDTLNEKYLKEGMALYEQFKKDMDQIEKAGGGHYGVESGYEVKTDNEQILSVARYVVNTVGSSSTIMKYDTLDKQNKIILTLPMLFKDKNYLEMISENIKEQMRTVAKEDPDKIYWLSGAGMSEEMADEEFESITEDQNFYINGNGKLVISFDKYEVAPGYMGIVEFEIPSNVLKDLLVSDEYIH